MDAVFYYTDAKGLEILLENFSLTQIFFLHQEAKTKLKLN